MYANLSQGFTRQLAPCANVTAEATILEERYPDEAEAMFARNLFQPTKVFSALRTALTLPVESN